MTMIPNLASARRTLWRGLVVLPTLTIDQWYLPLYGAAWLLFTTIHDFQVLPQSSVTFAVTRRRRVAAISTGIVTGCGPHTAPWYGTTAPRPDGRRMVSRNPVPGRLYVNGPAGTRDLRSETASTRGGRHVSTEPSELEGGKGQEKTISKGHSD